jgi:hypothetical protein
MNLPLRCVVSYTKHKELANEPRIVILVIGSDIRLGGCGTRSGAWIKIKLLHEREFVIGGYTELKGTRHFFGSLIVGFTGVTS